MIGIYKITNEINRKIYIGQSVDYEKRKVSHKTKFLQYCKSPENHKSGCIFLYNSFKKYGFENFTFELIEECLIDELNNREQYWMNFYSSYEREYGYNLCKIAGSSKGTIRNESTRLKNSESAKKRIGDKNPFYGKTHSDYSKNEMSKKRSGKKRKNISTEKWVEHKIWEMSYIKILQYDIWGNFIKEWNSLSEASNVTKIKKGRISESLTEHQPTAGGFIWKYFKEEYPLNIEPNISKISYIRNFNKYYKHIK
jgi:group I intron endonuclease